MQAAKDKQWGRIRPAGRQFDMPVLDTWFKILPVGKITSKLSFCSQKQISKGQQKK
jgi:hypothetical protein